MRDPFKINSRTAISMSGGQNFRIHAVARVAIK
jgi:hypothetical protein